jgi:hypothetical protein
MAVIKRIGGGADGLYDPKYTNLDSFKQVGLATTEDDPNVFKKLSDAYGFDDTLLNEYKGVQGVSAEDISTLKGGWGLVSRDKPDDWVRYFQGTDPSRDIDGGLVQRFLAWKKQRAYSNEQHQAYVDATNESPGRNSTIIVANKLPKKAPALLSTQPATQKKTVIT